MNRHHYPSHCPPSGMIRFNGESMKLDIKTAIYDDLLNDVHKAAALTHEALYITLQFYDPVRYRYSLKVRRLNACLFAEEDCLRESEDQTLLEWIASTTGRLRRCSWEKKVHFYVNEPPSPINNPSFEVVIGEMNGQFLGSVLRGEESNASGRPNSFGDLAPNFDYRPINGDFETYVSSGCGMVPDVSIHFTENLTTISGDTLIPSDYPMFAPATAECEIIRDE